MIHDIGNDLADVYNTGYSDGLKDGKNSSTRLSCWAATETETGDYQGGIVNE